jgi:helicase
MLLLRISMLETAITANPPQAQILASGILVTGFSCVLQMPTGSGKTWLSQEAIDHVLKKGLRAVYLTPLKALASEVAEDWKERFPDASVGVFTGDFGRNGQKYPVPFKDARIMIMTPERLDACTRSWRSHWHWIPQVDLVVVDEFHLLGDRSRGGRLEGAMCRIRRLNPFVRFLCLSATLGNRTELANWLGGVEYASDWRPIELTWTIEKFRRASDKPALLSKIVQANTQNGGRSLVFVQSRRRAEQLVVHLQENGLRAGFHHAGLTYDKRHKTEGLFREGELNVLVATATLEMGLNMPARQVVLYDLQQFNGKEFAPLPCRNVWQRGGRAGRPGLDDRGEVVLMAPAWENTAKSYLRGVFEPVLSRLSDPRVLAEQIIAEITGRYAWNEEQLTRVLQGSLAAHQSRLTDVGATVQEMLAAGMLTDEIEEDDGTTDDGLLRVTKLGRVACRHMLLPATVRLFRDFLINVPDPTYADLLTAVTSTEDAAPVIPADFEEVPFLQARVAAMSSWLLENPEQLRRRTEINGKRLLAALKMTLVMLDWSDTGDEDETAECHGCYPFEVTRLKESLSRQLLAMSAVARFTDDVKDCTCRRIELLRHMIEHGLNTRAATLTLVDGVGGVWARRLLDSGISDLPALAGADPEQLALLPKLSLNRAQAWCQSAQTIIDAGDLPVEEPRVEPSAMVPRSRPSAVDPYRLRRAMDLNVTPLNQDHWLVTGGLEPHVVETDAEDEHCDCADFAKGHRCKHILAVCITRDEASVRQQVKKLGDGSRETDGLDLFALWADR